MIEPPIVHAQATPPFYSTRSAVPEKPGNVNPNPPNTDWLLVLISVLLLVTLLIAWSVGLLF